MTKGDRVVADKSGFLVQCRDGFVRLTPIYCALERVSLGSLRLDFVLKEITDSREFADWEALSKLHYRGHDKFGRTARLIVRNYHPLYPRVIGFVELATPLYMSKPRANVLDAPFTAGRIGWDNWNTATMREHIHVIVRIARCVVHPEFRGIGLGRLLVNHAVRFARERWQVGGVKPLFLEVSADMLRYVPFVSGTGMHFIGETQGNLHRVVDDLTYLLQNRHRVDTHEILREETFGVVDTQVSRMRAALRLMKERSWTKAELLKRLAPSRTNGRANNLHLFAGIISSPKPSYLLGLQPSAEEFLAKRLHEIRPPREKRVALRIRPVESPLQLKSVSYLYNTQLRPSSRTRAIQHAFGIEGSRMPNCVIRDLSVEVFPGQIVLVTGPSGAGKTTLLRLIRNGRQQTGKVLLPANARVGTLLPLASDRALVDSIGISSIGTALNLLGVVALSDAFVYLRRFRELSAGQQYRAMLARLIATGANVWLADEFGGNLDSATSAIVATRLRRLVTELGVMLFVASSCPEPFISALAPDTVIVLSSTEVPIVENGNAFTDRLQLGRKIFGPPQLTISAFQLRRVRSGYQCQCSTSRLPNFATGDLVKLQSPAGDAFGRVADIRRSQRGAAASDSHRRWVVIVSSLGTTTN